jgi:hypothetical protein
MKMAVFWVVPPCSLKHLWNFGKIQPDHTAQEPRRQPSSNLVWFTYSKSCRSVLTLIQFGSFQVSWLKFTLYVYILYSLEDCDEMCYTGTLLPRALSVNFYPLWPLPYLRFKINWFEFFGKLLWKIIICDLIINLLAPETRIKYGWEQTAEENAWT